MANSPLFSCKRFPGRRFRVTGLIGVLWLLGACSPNQRPDTLVIGGPFEFTSQDPSRDGEVYTRLQVAETLLEVDDAGMLQPGLATAWDVDPDQRVWRFQLRGGVKFHDGSSLTADAAVNSLRIAHAKAGVLQSAPIASIDAEDNWVVVRLTAPYRPLGAIMAHFTTQLLAPSSYSPEGIVSQLSGTGPYRIDEVEPPHFVKVERFEGYWGAPAQIPNASYLTGHRAESRALQVMSGQTDIIYTLDPASLDLLRRRDDVVVHSQAIPRTLLLKLNAGHPLLASVDTRQAISLALDRSGLARHIVRVDGSEANQLIPPMFSDWHLSDAPALAYDPPAAAALLQAQGWSPDADGILVRDGQRFFLELMTYADRPELVVLATAIQAQLRAIGIEVAVSVPNSSSIPLGHRDNTLQMALVARNYGNIADPLGVMLADFGGVGGGDWGAMNWDNRALLAHFDAMRGETDPVRYRELGHEVARTLRDELPVIPVLFYTQQTAVAARVQGFRFDPFERNYGLAGMGFTQP